jgi:hypothetical protein
MEANQALFDELFRGKVVRARQMTPEQRVVESLRHSDACGQIMRDGVRHQFPAATEEEVTNILVERIRRVEQIRRQR